MKKIASFIMGTILTAGLMFQSSMTAQAAKITTLEVNEEEYNLLIEDYPSFTSEWNSLFAKMNNTKDTTAYALSLFDDQESSDSMVDALNKNGNKVDSETCLAMDILLYKLDADDEYYPYEGSINLTVICPIPDEWAETADQVQLYNLNSSNKPQTVSFSLVSVNEVPCAKFTLKDSGIYSFVQTNAAVESMEEPTAVPTAVPTIVVEMTEDKVYSQLPADNNSTQVETKPQAQKAPQATTQTTARPIDKTPQTGDTAPLGLWTAVSAVSGLSIIGLFVYLKKK